MEKEYMVERKEIAGYLGTFLLRAYSDSIKL